MPNVSLREFARRQEWNPGYAHKLKAAGRLVMVQENGKDLVDVEASLAKIADSRDLGKAHMQGVNAQQRAMHRGGNAPPAAPPGMGSANSTYHQAKTAREVYEAKNAQLDFEERAGRLVDVAQVRTRVEARAGAMRMALRQIPARLAPLLALEADQAAVQAILQAEIDRLLQDQAGLPPI